MSPKKNVVMVVNPISGDLDKQEFTAAAEAYAVTAGLNFVLYETTGERDISKIKKLYQKHRPQRVLVAGGDGTIKMVAEALESEDVILGILPAGSANGLAVDLNFPTTIDDNKSLHLSDIGLNAELIKNYENSSIRGKLGYMIQSVNTLTNAPVQFNAVIEANGQTLNTTAKMIVVANSQKYGTGVIINPVGKMDDGKFEIVIIRNLDLLVFGKIITGNMPLETDDVEIISCESAKIKTDIRVHFQIDGEYYDEI